MLMLVTELRIFFIKKKLWNFVTIYYRDTVENNKHSKHYLDK